MSSPPPKASLVTWSLVKYFKNRKVVDSVMLEVCAGEIVGLLGPKDALRESLMVKPNLFLP